MIVGGPFMVQGGSPTITFLGGAVDPASVSSYSFSIDIGSGGFVVVGVHGEGTSGSVSDVAIDGVSLTETISIVESTASAYSKASIFHGFVSSQNVVTVSVTFSSSQHRAGIAAYKIEPLGSETPVWTDSKQGGGVDLSPGPISFPGSGVPVGVGITSTDYNDDYVTWSSTDCSVAETYETAVENSVISSALIENVSDGDQINAAMTDGISAEFAAVFAVWI